MDRETLPHPKHHFGLKFCQSLLEYLISGTNEYNFFMLTISTYFCIQDSLLYD